MKTTLILNPKYNKLRSTTNILGYFCYVQFCYCTFGRKSKAQNRSDIGFSGRRDEVYTAAAKQ